MEPDCSYSIPTSFTYMYLPICSCAYMLCTLNNSKKNEKHPILYHSIRIFKEKNVKQVFFIISITDRRLNEAQN